MAMYCTREKCGGRLIVYATKEIDFNRQKRFLKCTKCKFKTISIERLRKSGDFK